jgi:hypothetical protein
MSESTPTAPAGYPVTYDVEPQITDRNRLTSFFRIILAIPHLIIVGGPGFSLGSGFSFGGGRGGGFGLGGLGTGGVLGLVASVMALISWFAIVFTGRQPRGLWDFTAMYFRWRARAIAYMALLRDEYPPFGEGDYPVSFTVGDFPETRNRWSVGLRIFYVIPHLIVLIFVGIAWAVTAIIAWFAILFTGAYPEGLYRFAIGYLRWSLRVETYFLLMHDVYPPFSLEPA